MGQEFGPFTSTELRQHAAEGKVTRDAHIRKGNDGRWVVAESVNGLFERPPPRVRDAVTTSNAFTDSHAGRPSSSPKLTTCDNCGRSIGALESTHQYDRHVVCHECANRLQSHSTPTANSQKAPAPRRGEIICPNPNCGYVGKPKKQARGSLAMGCLLTLIMILPGLIYFALMSGYTYICPKCGVEIRSGTHS
jgi:hypothetical protein